MITESFKISHYDYDLPKNLIAQHPVAKRDQSRLLVLHRENSSIEHRKFFEITEYLDSGDVLVLNDTKVTPSRVIGYKETGGKVDALITKHIKDGCWEMLLKSNKKLKEGEFLYFDNRTVRGKTICKNSDGSWIVEFENRNEFTESLNELGSMPLPPYIKRDIEDNPLRDQDLERYQTVYANKTGAIAAPTAGLHFTDDLLKKITDKGIKIAYITLHVGLGTFKTIKEENFKHHIMHKEFYIAPQDTIETIKKARSNGNRIVATGTTACRVLESIAKNGRMEEESGWTDLFIYPPYKFALTDSLITNFHLQRTSLILLVSAFAGRENIITSYKTAISHGYRFYSYGDCMLVL